MAADNLTSAAVADLCTAASSSSGISIAAGFKTESWASGLTSVTDGGNSGGGDVVMGVSDAGEASVTAGPAAPAAANSAALLSISSIRRCTIRGISCT